MVYLEVLQVQECSVLGRTISMAGYWAYPAPAHYLAEKPLNEGWSIPGESILS